MFSSIRINDFRSCSNVLLDQIQNLTVLIGRNGAGKTNILKAIEWACYIGSHPLSKDDKSAGRIASQLGDVAFTFNVNDKTYCYHVDHGFEPEIDGAPHRLRRKFEETIYVSMTDGWAQIITRKNENVILRTNDESPVRNLDISDSIPCLIALQSLLSENDSFRILAKDLTDFLSTVRYYPLHNYDTSSDDYIVIGEKYQKWLAKRTTNENTAENLLCKIIYLSLEKKEKFEELKSLLGPNGLGLIQNITVLPHEFRIPDEKSTDERKVIYITTFIPGNVDQQASMMFGGLSFGTKRILFLLVSMLFDESSVFLMEQPEDGVHAGLVDKLVPLFRSYSATSQFIIASHSTAVLNRTNPSEVALVSINSGKTSVRKLDGNELAAARDYLEEDGPFAEFLQSIEED